MLQSGGGMSESLTSVTKAAKGTAMLRAASHGAGQTARNFSALQASYLAQGEGCLTRGQAPRQGEEGFARRYRLGSVGFYKRGWQLEGLAK
jgi:hypothetical protein